MHKLPQKFVVEFDTFRKLTFRERLKILFGFNLLALVKVVVDRRNTSVKQSTFILLTKQVGVDGQIAETATP